MFKQSIKRTSSVSYPNILKHIVIELTNWTLSVSHPNISLNKSALSVSYPDLLKQRGIELTNWPLSVSHTNITFKNRP